MTPPRLQSETDFAHNDGLPDDHFVTKGEHKFDRLTYGGLGYVANVGLSLGAVYWAERMPGGQKFMNGLVKKFGEWAPKIPAKWSSWAAARSFYLTGGFAVLVPMKLLENRKVDLIKKWDNEIYGPAADDPEIEKSHREIEQAPKQSWSSIMGSRVLALIPFYVTTLALWSHDSPLAKATNKKLYFDRPITAVSRGIGKVLGKATNNPEAVTRIERMQALHPGEMKEGIDKATRDPNHSALPYYFISEAITSAIVARAVYLLTRVLGPVLGTEGKKVTHPAPVVAQPTIVQPEVKEEPAVKNTPTVQVSAIEHQATASAPQLEAVR